MAEHTKATHTDKHAAHGEHGGHGHGKPPKPFPEVFIGKMKEEDKDGNTTTWHVTLQRKRRGVFPDEHIRREYELGRRNILTGERRILRVREIPGTIITSGMYAPLYHTFPDGPTEDELKQMRWKRTLLGRFHYDYPFRGVHMRRRVTVRKVA